MLLRLSVACCAFFSLSGCLSFIQHHGYPAAGVGLWNNVKVGITQKEILNTLGFPVIVENGAWIYPSCKIYGVAASFIRKYDCSTLKIFFDEENLVSEVERLNMPLRGLQKIDPSGTPIAGINDGMYRNIKKAFTRSKVAE